MRWLDLDSDACSIARTLDVLSDRWTLLVLRDAANGVSRFDDFADHLGIAPAVLSRRLRTLVGAGVLDRVPYQPPGERTRHRYRLTDKGRDLFPILVALAAWGDRHTAGAEGPPIELVHRDCGAAVRISVVCEAGHELAGGHEIRSRPGPGARYR